MSAGESETNITETLLICQTSDWPVERYVSSGSDPVVDRTDLLERQKISMWESLAAYTTPEIQRVVEFAKRIPNFTDLIQEHQLVLIKTGFFELWLIRMARMFNPQFCTITLSDGEIICRDQLEIIYNTDLVRSIFQFASGFNDLHLNDGEIGLFCAVVLLAPDRVGLSDARAVEAQQEKLIEALKLQLSRNHSSDPQLFSNLIMKLSELRTVGKFSWSVSF
ncbi:unnamed protein product [Soboliphyme baturini]|uniref:NR LBD domain-containing protein n=1 Tax=Soboliphyme baturini TaxID=241478 RepID=A0A183J5D3_9BILA|nr:unnamed protein product [Soboliphyme baturini]